MSQSSRPAPTLMIAAILLSLVSSHSMASGTLVVFSPELINGLSKAQIQKLLDIRNAKGERIIKKKSADVAEEWATKDPQADGVQGTSTDKAYKEFTVKQTAPVIVAVIDSGVDITHEDLQGHIWTNTKEIPNNGIDDDGDGFIDDVNGWNFLGTVKDGKNVNVGANTLEVTREYVRLQRLAAVGELSASDKAYLKEVESVVNESLADAQSSLPAYQQLDQGGTVLEKAGLSPDAPITAESLAALQSTDPNFTRAKQMALRIVQMNPGASITTADLHEIYKTSQAKVLYQYNVKYNSSDVVGDDPTKLEPVCASASTQGAADCLKVSYGNNDMSGRDEKGEVMDLHGTHVAGIIAALRGNNIGIEGQAQNVQIMPIRAVPNGDERDKDVANAIRFAVDHGAKVVNMSFGKAYPNNKSWVDDAVKYAQSKGVILVHAAGNEGQNTEEANRDRTKHSFNFPNKKFYDAAGNVTGEASNWIEVGASSKDKGAALPADFSNWGKTSVDLFAPGVDIKSTVPNNKYKAEQGTSMASPETAGVAAFLWSVFPSASDATIRNAMLNTVTRYDDLSPVNKPGAEGEKIAFADLSVTGGIVNSYAAATWIKANAPNSEKIPTAEKSPTRRKGRAGKRVRKFK